MGLRHARPAGALIVQSFDFRLPTSHFSLPYRAIRLGNNIVARLNRMKKTSNHSAAGTVIYGLFILVPVAVVFLLLVKLTEILEKIAAPLGLESNFGAAIALLIAIVIALLVVLLFSWIVGAIMRRVVSYQKFETTILNQIPGYQIIANIAKGFSDGDS